MPKANIVQTNFTAGEISPITLGRVDLERYRNAVQEMENFLPQIQGGAHSTPMRRFNAEAKFTDRKCRLIRFIFSKTEANMLEFGHNYIRFFNQDRTQVMAGMVPYEIATVYDEDELFELEYVGTADTILLFHENHPVQRLRRFANDNWVIDDAPFDPQPFFEQGFGSNDDLTLSQTTPGAGVSLTVDGGGPFNTFREADVGRQFTAGAGLALITGYVSQGEIEVTIQNEFESTAVTGGTWTILGSPQAQCTPSKDGEVGETINLTLGDGLTFGDVFTLDQAVFSGPSTIEFRSITDHGYLAGDTVVVDDCIPYEYNGTYEIIAVPTTTRFDVTYGPDPGSITTLGTVKELISGSSTEGWRLTDVGSFVKINGGLLKITAYNSEVSVDAIVVQKMTSDVPAEANAWSLNQEIWNDENGYPRCGVFFQQSLVVGGSPAFPHSISKSVIGEPFNFTLGVNDDDAFLYTLDVSEFDPIIHLTKVKNQLLALTTGSEYTLTGGVEAPMTPTNVQIDNPTAYGANEVRPVRVANDIVFINRSGTKYRALGYELTRDSFASPDLTKLSEHITGTGIVDMTYQQEPESIIWAVRDDGVIVTLCIDRAEGILAFARQVPTEGTTYESVESIPAELGTDEVWCVVNTGSNRYIESFDRSTPYGVASAISETVVTPTDVLSGLDHLEGQEVEVVGDGVIAGTFTVSGGQVQLTEEYTQFYAGLSSHGRIKTVNPEFLTQFGSAQGNPQRIGKVFVRVFETFALEVNGNQLQFCDNRQFGGSLLDQPIPAFTGDKEITRLGWQDRAEIEIEQANALPVNILSIIMQTTVNNE